MALLPATLALEMFRVNYPASRGQNSTTVNEYPCGGFNHPQAPTKVKARQEFEMQVPRAPGQIDVFYRSAHDLPDRWEPVGGYLVLTGADFVGFRVDFHRKVQKNAKGVVMARFIDANNPTESDWQYQCVDVSHGDDVKNASAGGPRVGMVIVGLALAGLVIRL
ncbi:hypothetical protein H4R33_003155 [Dimargaris cristalligena]|nr:hypothetical protein H4R33_003155 [Dimargaris cristalligena]